MRTFITAATAALGIVALCSAVLPLSAQHRAEHAETSPAISKALFLCRAQSGVDHACVRALAKALMLDTKPNAPTEASNPRCNVDQQMLANPRQHN